MITSTAGARTALRDGRPGRQPPGRSFAPELDGRRQQESGNGASVHPASRQDLQPVAANPHAAAAALKGHRGPAAQLSGWAMRDDGRPHLHATDSPDGPASNRTPALMSDHWAAASVQRELRRNPPVRCPEGNAVTAHMQAAPAATGQFELKDAPLALQRARMGCVKPLRRRAARPRHVRFIALEFAQNSRLAQPIQPAPGCPDGSGIQCKRVRAILRTRRSRKAPRPGRRASSPEAGGGGPRLERATSGRVMSAATAQRGVVVSFAKREQPP